MMPVPAHGWRAQLKKFLLPEAKAGAMSLVNASANATDAALPPSEPDNLVWQRAVQVAVLFAIDPVGR